MYKKILPAIFLKQSNVRKGRMFFLLLLFFSGSLRAQLSINAIPAAAACPNSGSITVTVTAGGTPNYTYAISSTAGCLPAAIPPVVTNAVANTFTNLQGGCSYTITVTDNTGLSTSRNVTVADTYPAMTLPDLTAQMGSALSCTYLTAVNHGGTPPYIYTFYTGNSALNPAAIIQSGSSNILPLAAYSTGTYTVKVKDNCNTERIASVTTGPFRIPGIILNDLWRPACPELRVNIQTANLTGGITVDMLDRNGNHISGTTPATGFTYAFPYTLTDTVLTLHHPWGLSGTAVPGGDHAHDLPVPNNFSLFPVTIKITDNTSCNNLLTLSIPYPYPPGSTAYVSPGTFEEQCGGTICVHLGIRRPGQLLAGAAYPVSYALSETGTFTPAGSFTGSDLQVCGLQPNTVYWFKTTDPCTGRDTAVSLLTPLIKPFQVAGGIISYCVNPASPAYFATASFSFPQAPGLPQARLISGPGAPRLYNTTLISGLVPGNYVFEFTDACGVRTQTMNITVAGTYATDYATALTYTQSCSDNCITITARGTASGTIVPNGFISNYFTTFAAAQGSLTASVLHNGSHTICGLQPGKYYATTAPYFPGITCIPSVKDTIIIPAYNLPVIDKVYNVHCSSVNNIVAPMPAGADTGFVFTLYNNAGNIVAGPQSLNGNPSAVPPIIANATPSVFSNITGAAGDIFSVRITDRCGNSAVSPVTLGTDFTISGSVSCGPAGPGGIVSTDSLKADFIPGASYTWTSPSGEVYGPSSSAVFTNIPAENGLWTLDAQVTLNGCASAFHNVLAASCNVVPVKFGYVRASAKACSAFIEWETEEEINTERFDIEITDINGYLIKNAGSIPAAGNSGIARRYYFTDALPGSGTYYYRIKEYDKDGRYTYSNVLPVKIKCSGSAEEILVSPNPAAKDGTVNIETDAVTARKGELVFTDAAGKKYLTVPVTIAKGHNQFWVSTKGFAAGVYFIRLITDRPLKPVKLIIN